MKRLAAVSMLVLFVSGCASGLPALSAGKIGCPPDNIAITDYHRVSGGWTWVATCNGKRFICSAVSTGNDCRDISCAAELKP